MNLITKPPHTMPSHAAISLPANRERAFAFGEYHNLRLSGDETAGLLGLWDEKVSPGEGPPLHVHHREEELFCVLEGEFRFWCGEESVEAGAGASLFLPRGIPHRFQNIGKRDGYLLIGVTPAGFERFFAEIERRGVSPEAINAVAADFGLEFLV